MSDGPSARLRLDVAYDGTDFSGWASQPGLRTVQGTLEEWIATLTRWPRVELVCAGRTDAGVHARGQVCHLDVGAAEGFDSPAHCAERLRARLARALPADVVVPRVTVAPDGFDARFSAVWRRYVYRLADRGRPDPLLRRSVVHTLHPLDVDAMNAAAGELLGLRDFAAFCKRREGASTIRTLLDLHAARVDDRVEVTVRADAFCHSMVRSLMGALTAVGSGRRDLAWLRQVREQTTTRPGSIHVMAAHGLTLEEVGYPGDDELAARAFAARARRGPDDLADPRPFS